MNFDYRSMLKRYIQHVTDQEGIDFIDRSLTSEGGLKRLSKGSAGYRAFPIFTEEEIIELNKLAEEG